MSGTSADSIDAVLVDFRTSPPRLIAQYEHPLSPEHREQIIALSSAASDSLAQALILDRELGASFADAVKQLLLLAKVSADRVHAIGSHGQTLRHHPRPDAVSKTRFTLQVGDPNTIAELTGIDVVADFRRRDLAAEGEAAPLAPGFHWQYFSHPEVTRAIINIGGFSNLTLLAPGQEPQGFDTGPGNCLLDGWYQRHQVGAYDKGGQWAAVGRVNGELLTRLLAHPYLRQTPPKSTGRESFHLSWLDSVLQGLDLTAEDVQSTLLQLTVDSICTGLTMAGTPVQEIYLCGGGALNTELIERLEASVGAPVRTTAALGVDPKLVEGFAFAWMARQTLSRKVSNLPSVTGSRGPRILGGIYQA